ncbi:MAG: bifunctional folylpolyglutamate synthase/dihydrofolate synthase, partial [Syntrophaceae bacterium]|nr:bifunctional folylpolyglutamate synthase/dihydrofolate synthase [Syntrophaceae bacterium]
MTYPEALSSLSGMHHLGIRLGLEPIASLLGRLGNPQDRYPTLLVAGTNGKGSVAAMTAAMLAAGGYRTALYTSPDLIDVRERIRIDGRMIGRGEMARCIREVKAQVTEEVSYFEFLTAVAMLHFYNQRVDIAILEVGMGGRLDATNVVTPLVSVITNVSLDHQAYLGRTLSAIAREKGGIIKPGVPCLTAALQRPVVDAIQGICREENAPFYRLGDAMRLRIHRDGRFSYQGLERRFDRLTCPLPGRHQRRNAALALGILELIAPRFPLDERVIRRGLRQTRWEGRLEILGRRPLLLVDGAHNPAGAAALRRALLEDFSYRRLWLIFGVLGDKDYRRIAAPLFPLAHEVILTRPGSDRALPMAALLPAAAQYQCRIVVREDPGKALQYACSRAGDRDLICVSGSLYLVGDIKGILR